MNAADTAFIITATALVLFMTLPEVLFFGCMLAFSAPGMLVVYAPAAHRVRGGGFLVDDRGFSTGTITVFGAESSIAQRGGLAVARLETETFRP